MKIYYILLAVAILLGFVFTTALLPFMPSEIPAHYNLAGEVDRMGSPLEQFIFPALSLVTGVICMACARAERQKSADSEHINLFAGIWSVLLLNGMGLYFGIQAIRYTEGAASGMGVFRFCGSCIGALLVFLGMLMPKSRRGSSFGLRTRWSVHSDAVWHRTQILGSRLMMGAGVGFLVLSLAMPDVLWCVTGWIFLMLAVTAGSYLVSWRVYKKYG